MLRFCKVLPTLLLALIALPGVARADFTATANLLSSSERPTPHNTPALGFATIIYNAALNALSYSVTFSGLSSPATASHIHFGGPSVSGPVILPFTNMGPPSATSGSFTGTLTAANLINTGSTGITTIADAANAIQMGNAYVNLHDSLFPGGEIRGQLTTTAVPEPGSIALLLAGGLAGGSLFLHRRRK